MKNQRFKEEVIVLITLLSVGVLLVIRYYGMYPSIMPDEYMHSKFARLVSYSEIEIPGYAYYFVYAITNLCGDSFIECARILNVLFLTIGGYFVFKVSRLYLKFTLALSVGITSLAMPMNTYASYFMPEAMYFGVFWLVQYTIFSKLGQKSHSWIVPGLLLGFLALIKPHAHFLLPVYVILILIEQGAKRSAIRDVVSLLLCFTLVRYGLGALFAGAQSFSIFGVQYSQHASTALSDVGSIITATRSLMLNSIGNVVVLALLFGLPLLFMAQGVFNTKTGVEYRLHMIPLLILLVMVPVVALFATSTALFDANVDNRIHLRYYSFLFPYFFIIVFKQFDAKPVQIRSTSTIYATVFLVILSLILPYYHHLNQFLYPYAIVVTDIPEIFLLIQYSLLLYLVAVVGVASLIVWIRMPSVASRLYMLGFVPLFLSVTWFTNFKVKEVRYKEQTSDIAGKYIRENLSSVSQDSLLVVGYMKNNTERTLMYSKSKSASSMTLSLMEPFAPSHIPQGTRYIVTLDSLDLTPIADVMWKEKSTYLYRLR